MTLRHWVSGVRYWVSGVQQWAQHPTPNTQHLTGKSSLLAVGCWLWSLAAAAQTGVPDAPLKASKATTDSRYERAKALMATGKYRFALAELQTQTIANAPRILPSTNAATYLWAVAALRDSRAREAEPVLRLLRTRQPKWEGIPDVILLQAMLAEAIGEPERARTILNEMPDGVMTAEVAAMTIRLGLTGRTTEGATGRAPVRVAALLPLGLDADAADPDGARRTQFGQELYAGMRLAADSLRTLGTLVDVRVFDLGNDTVATKALLAKPDLGVVDLIVGPVYKNPSRLVARAAAARATPVVNPLSEDGTLLDGNPTLYLLRPSVQTQARTAAALAYARFEPKTAVLLVEETKDDGAFATAFRTEFEALGGTIKAEESMSSQTYRTRMTETVNALALDSLDTGGLVVASKEINAARQIAGRLARDNRRLPVLAPAAWLEMPDLSLDQFNNQPFYFLAPVWRDGLSDGNRQFRRVWQARYGVPPSDYARAGFELLFTFAPLIRPGAGGITGALNRRGLQPGPLSAALGYPAGARDNQGVTILHLTNRRVEVVK